MTRNLKLGIKLTVGIVAVVALGGGMFIVGLLTGHKSEQTLMSSADASFVLNALRHLEANDVPAAKNELFTMLELKVLTHWDASQATVGDYPEGTAPMDVVLIQRVMKGRVSLLSDPDIAAFRQSERRTNKYSSAMESKMQEIEKRYLVQR
jgi:hypothetical protein